MEAVVLRRVIAVEPAFKNVEAGRLSDNAG